MIVILGNSIEIPGYTDATEHLVNYHVDVSGARMTDQLETRLLAGGPVKLSNMSELWPYSEYKNVLKSVNASYTKWYIYDNRLALFLDEFAKLVGEVKLIFVNTSPLPYTARLKKAFEAFQGDKLEITDAKSAGLVEFIS